MTTTQNKLLAQRYFDTLNAHDIDAVTEMFAPEVVNHAAVPEAQGADGVRRILSKVFTAFPDLSYRCEDLLAEGDRVVCRVTMQGTNTGPIEFLSPALKPSGKRFATENIHILRIHDGRFVEHWAGRDDVGMMRQLGHLGSLTGGN